MRKRFWEIIIDRKSLTFEILGISSDDTLLTDNVAEMIQAGMQVACNTPDASTSKSDLKIDGYKHELGLYERLIAEYHQSTKKRLKRW